MKLLIGLVCILFSINGLAKVEMAVSSYAVISDTESPDVPLNLVRIKGQVFDQNQQPLLGTIYSMNEEIKSGSDLLGNYELLIPASDTAIFFYAENYKEILVPYYDFKGGHTVVINFYASPKVKVIEQENMMISYKPVIYLYAEEELSATVSLNYNGDLTFTYPAYKEEWDVLVSKDKIIERESGNAVPYLFWEGEMKGLAFDSEDESLLGSVVHTDTLVDYLENQLADLGLNRKEQTDFITFWAPRMIETNYVFIQFLVDEAYAKDVAEINISPKPDAVRRVYLLYSAFENEPTLNSEPQVFEKFDRKGFTVVEWGGSAIKMNHYEG